MIPVRFEIALLITFVCFLAYAFTLKGESTNFSAKLNAILYGVLGFCWTLCLFESCYKWYAYLAPLIIGVLIWLLYTAFAVYPKIRSIIGKTGVIIRTNGDLPDGTNFYIGKLNENNKEINVVSDFVLKEGDKFIVTEVKNNLNYIELI